MKKFITLFLTFIVVVVSICFVGCNKENENIVKYVGLKVYDPVYIAKDKGFFEEEGIDVEIVDVVAGGATATQMVASGDVQAGLLSTMALINAKSSGLSVIGVADIQSAFNESPLEEFFVKKDSGINSVADLKGKTIAINLVKSSFHYTWVLALKNAGLNETDVNFVNIPFSEQESALMSGRVDAIGLMQPYTKSARNNEELKTLYNAVDCFGERQFCEIFMNENWANNNVEKATKFVSAIVKACKWVEENQLEAKQIISKYSGVSVENIDDYKFQENAKCVEEDCQYWIDFMIEYEGISSNIKVSDIITNKFNKKVVGYENAKN